MPVDERLTPNGLLKEADHLRETSATSPPLKSMVMCSCATVLTCTAALVAALDRQTDAAERMGDQP